MMQNKKAHGTYPAGPGFTCARPLLIKYVFCWIYAYAVYGNLIMQMRPG